MYNDNKKIQLMIKSTKKVLNPIFKHLMCKYSKKFVYIKQYERIKKNLDLNFFKLVAFYNTENRHYCAQYLLLLE